MRQWLIKVFSPLIEQPLGSGTPSESVGFSDSVVCFYVFLFFCASRYDFGIVVIFFILFCVFSEPKGCESRKAMYFS